MQEELDPKWVVERAVLAAKMPPSSKLVMLVMLTHSRPQALYLNGSSPGQREIAKETGLSLPCVQEHLRLLEANGWLIPHRQPKGKRSQYELTTGESFTESKVTKPVSHSVVTKPVSHSEGVTKPVSQSVTKPVSHSDQPSWSRLEKSSTRSKEDLEGGKPDKGGLAMSGPAPWDDDYPGSDSLKSYEQDMASRRNLEEYDLTPLKPVPAPEPETFDDLLGPAENDDYDFQRLLDLTF